MKRWFLSLGILLLGVSCTRSLASGIPVLESTALPHTPTSVLATGTPATPGIPVTGNTPAISATPAQRSALSFDGQNDYVRVPDNPSLDLQNGFTIAVWIYLDSYTGWASIVTKGDKPNLNNYAIQQSEALDPQYHTEPGHLRFTGCYPLPVPLPESRTVLSLKTWHFVAVTLDRGLIRFYTDGMPDGSSLIQGPLCTNDAPLYIGVDFPLSTEYWHGAMDDLRIWNVPLTETQLRDLMNGTAPPVDTSLVGDWSFDEGSGTIAHDSSSYHNDGQIVGDPVWIQPTHYP